MPLSDGTLLCIYRSVDGWPVHAYSRNDGRSWTPPGVELQSLRTYGRALRVSEAIASFRAGPTASATPHTCAFHDLRRGRMDPGPAIAPGYKSPVAWS